MAEPDKRPVTMEELLVSSLAQTDALAMKFHATHDMKVKDEIDRLAREYGKLAERWVFGARAV
jgi:HAMP domain-containing protein